MSSGQKRLPGAWMLLLSALGFLFSSATALLVFNTSRADGLTPAEQLALHSFALLAAFLALLHLPALYHAIRLLRGREARVRFASLFRFASLSLIAWAAVLFLGNWVAHMQVNSLLLAPLTILAIALPAWWLVEFARRGLPRPASEREWAAVSISITLAPLLILTLEIMLVVAAVITLVVALGWQPEALRQLWQVSLGWQSVSSDRQDLERIMNVLAHNPAIAAALFGVVGVLAPFVEELFKPLAVWLASARPVQPRDGFMLGMISGAAFTFLESVSQVSQITALDWLPAVLLRCATGWLHIGLSGLVGYGIAQARADKHWGIALVCLLGATALHGAWNSLALLNGFSASGFNLPGSAPVASAGDVLTVVLLVIVFILIGLITLTIRRRLILMDITDKA